MKEKIKVVCIQGKSGCGKSTVSLEILKSIPNTYMVKSPTTRKRREYDPMDSKTHVFVGEDYLDMVKETGNVLAIYESPKGYCSFTTKDCFKKNAVNLYAIDAKAYKDISENEDFEAIAIYLRVPEIVRRQRYLNREGGFRGYSSEEHLSEKHLKGLQNVNILDVSDKKPQEIVLEIKNILLQNKFIDK